MTSNGMRTNKFKSINIDLASKKEGATSPNFFPVSSPLNDVKKAERAKMPITLKAASKTAKNTPISSPIQSPKA